MHQNERRKKWNERKRQIPTSRNFLLGKIQSTEISATNEIRVQVKRHSPSKLEASKPLILPDASDPSSISLVDHSLATKPFLCCVYKLKSDEHNAETRSLDGVERLSQQEYAPPIHRAPPDAEMKRERASHLAFRLGSPFPRPLAAH